jgi:hypothetical protein
LISTGALLLLTGCGSISKPSSPNGFGRAASGQVDSVLSVKLNPPGVVGGTPASITVVIAQPAPAGITVILDSSDPTVVPSPSNLEIAMGQTSATLLAATSVVTASTAVTITATYNGSTAGADLSVVPNPGAQFSVALQPATVTVQQGHSGFSKAVTKVAAGYNHSLQLKTSGQPTGVSTSLKPSLIPAPGAGSSQLRVSVQGSVATGSYPIAVTASDGTNSSSAILTLNVTSSSTNPNATFKGCWYKQSGHSYQAVDISVGNPGTYPFNAILYQGSTCDPNSIADQIGFGNLVTFGGFGYTFWFTDFADQTSMSALWSVGIDSSQCVNYSVAPSC